MALLLDRHWLLTTTTYGTWLAGDPRGFVSRVLVAPEKYELHNQPGESIDQDLPKLEQSILHRMDGPAVLLSLQQAEVVRDQLIETTGYRGWQLLVASVMSNHVHVLVSVTGDPEPSSLLRDLKSYASRSLNRSFGEREGNRWWTRSGSKRKMPDERAVRAATRYVWHQKGWLARYVNPNVPKEWLT